MNRGLLVLAFNTIKAKKIRTFVVSVAIILTAILFITVGGITSCIYQSLEISKQLATGSSFHALLNEVSISKVGEIDRHKLVEECYIMNDLGQVKTENTKSDGNYEGFELYSCNDATILNHMFITIMEGSYPVSDHHILMDKEYLIKHNIPLTIGSEISLYNNNDDKKTYILSGYYSAITDNTAIRPAFTKSDVNSKATVYVLLKNPINIEGKIKKIILDLNVELSYQVNEAFNLAKSDFFNIQNIGILIFVFLLILICGFLVIYNIYFIAITGEIKFYGLLKTLGTTSKQLKKFVFYQVTIIYCFSIPIGLFLGYIIGWKVLSPLFMTLSGKKYIYTLHPSLFVFTVLFTYVTILVSAISPVKKITHMSCTRALIEEGIKDFDSSATIVKEKVSLWYIAYKNLKRNPKKTIISIGSITISVLLFLFTFSMTQYLLENPKVQIYDFCIDELKEILNLDKEHHLLLEKDVLDIQQIAGVTDVIPIYSKSIKEVATQGEVNKITIYGIPNEAIDYFKMNWFAGTFNKEFFKAGTNAITNTYTYIGKADEQNSFYEVDEQISLDKLKNQYYIQALEIASRPILSNFTILNYYPIFDVAIYLPLNQFKFEFSNYHIESINVKVEKGCEDMVLEQLTSIFDSNIQVRDKRTQLSELNERFIALKITGYSLSMILAIIGILNYLNVTICGLHERKREMALLNIVGMTQRQIFICLIFECLYYVLLAVLTSSVFGFLCFKILYLTMDIKTNIRFIFFLIMVVFLFLITVITNFLVHQQMKRKLPIEALRNSR